MDNDKNKYNLRKRGKKKMIIRSDTEEDDDDYDYKDYSIRKNKQKRKRKREDSSSSEDEVEEYNNPPIIFDFGKFLSGLEENDEEQEALPDPVKIKYLDSLSSEAKRKLLEREERILKPIAEDTVPLRYKILNMDLDDKTASMILHKVIEFEKMNPMFGASEYYKIKKYIDGFVKIPFGKYKNLTIHKSDDKLKIREFFSRLEYNLTSDIYGQQKAKNTILQIMGSWITNPEKTGNVIGLHGCPGTGKTSIAKAFAKSLDIPVVFIPLGGLSAGVTLNGSDYVFEGSGWGKIISSLMETGCMNPVFFFDELDKVSDTKEGNDVINLLIHLTDPSQNNEFTDKYFSGVNFDLSRCFFIFSFNDKNLINPVLRDRLNLVKMDDFNNNDKVVIAQRYSLTKISKTVGIDTSIFNIPEDTLKSIAFNYCSREKGVRKLEQCLKTIIMKINLYYLTGDYTSLQLDEKCRKLIEFPLTITPDLATSLLESVYSEDINTSVMMMYL